MEVIEGAHNNIEKWVNLNNGCKKSNQDISVDHHPVEPFVSTKLKQLTNAIQFMECYVSRNSLLVVNRPN